MNRKPSAHSTTDETARLMSDGHRRHLADLGFLTDADYRRWCVQNRLRSTPRKTWKERRAEVRLRERQKEVTQAEQNQRQRAARLGFPTPQAYLAWCEAQGLSLSLRKTEAQSEAETRLRTQERGQEALAERRILHHRPDLVLEAIFRGETTPRIKREARFSAVISALARPQIKNKTRQHTLELFRCALKYTRMISDEWACPQYGGIPSNTFAHALSQVAELYAEWRRPLALWKCPNTDPLTQFRSLVHHLFGEYKTPDFLISAWFAPEESQAAARLLFLTLASGGSLRGFPLPIALTHREKHAFLQAPESLTVASALRWAQAVGRGASPALAKAMLGSRLREILPDEPFWDTVVRFFVDHHVPSSQVSAMVDYLSHRRFAQRAVLHQDGVIRERAASEPGFTLKGRTFASLLRDTEAWHRNLQRYSLSTFREWNPMAAQPLELWQKTAACPEETGGEPKTELWMVGEILNTRELHAEGAAQHHCAATYHSDCLGERSSIWSVRRWIEEKEKLERVLTVEVNPSTRTVVQIRGKCNQRPCALPENALLKSGLMILTRWAQKNGLRIANSA